MQMIEETDIQYFDEIKLECIDCEKNLQKLMLQFILNGKYDCNPCYLSVHSGAGGTESNDWAQMLLRMYMRYCERAGFKTKLIEEQLGDSVGYKSATLEIDGDSYGYLKAEKGVHRLVRISPFDANKRRHTSFASVEVIPLIEDEETGIIIQDEDLKIDTFRAGGAGGQHINKTDSAVRIKHIPTGIVVQCQDDRSQMRNKESALRILKSKLIALKEEENTKKFNEIVGELKKIEWGSQIRSYVFQPYTMVKDHRTSYETPDIVNVLDGDIQDFISDYLIKSKKE